MVNACHQLLRRACVLAMMANEARSSKPTAASAPTAASFDAYSSELQAAALNSTKLAAALPPDIGFHRSVDKDFARAIETCSERTLRLTNKLLELSSGQSSSKGKAKLQDEEDVLDSFQALVGDVLDQLFEQAVRSRRVKIANMLMIKTGY